MLELYYYKVNGKGLSYVMWWRVINFYNGSGSGIGESMEWFQISFRSLVAFFEQVRLQTNVNKTKSMIFTL